MQVINKSKKGGYKSLYGNSYHPLYYIPKCRVDINVISLFHILMQLFGVHFQAMHGLE